MELNGEHGLGYKIGEQSTETLVGVPVRGKDGLMGTLQVIRFKNIVRTSKKISMLATFREGSILDWL